MKDKSKSLKRIFLISFFVTLILTINRYGNFLSLPYGFLNFIPFRIYLDHFFAGFMFPLIFLTFFSFSGEIFKKPLNNQQKEKIFVLFLVGYLFVVFYWEILRPLILLLLLKPTLLTTISFLYQYFIYPWKEGWQIIFDLLGSLCSIFYFKFLTDKEIKLKKK